MTLAFVAALHVAGWLWVGTPRPGAMAERTPNPRPIAIEWVTAPAAALRPPSAAAKRADRQRPRTATRTAQTQGTASPQPAQPVAAPLLQPDAAPMAVQDGASNRPPDGQRAVDGVGAPRFRYGGNAERAAAQAGSAGPAEQRIAEDELKRRTASAGKTDCRTAHADMGLLALPMLAYDALGDSKCRW
jgi:hypothetical protein